MVTSHDLVMGLMDLFQTPLEKVEKELGRAEEEFVVIEFGWS